jgi:hypothetical protein
MGTREDNLLYLADMRIDELQAENVKLQDENARLRSCLSDDAENARMIMAENEELRNAATMAWRLFVEYGSTHPCELPRVDAMRNGLREVGIEVD